MHYASADYLESFDTGVYGDPVFEDDFNDTAFFGKIVKSVTKAVKSVAAPVAKVVTNTVSSAAKGALQAGTGIAKFATTPHQALLAAAKGQNVIKAVTSNVKSGLSDYQKGIGAVTNNPIWDIAATGMSFIPGVGTAVSAGMATAAAVGRGAAAKDIALAAVRGAIPGGPLAQAAFDVGLGVVRGERLDNAALGAVRKQIPGGEIGKAAFDAAVMVAKGKHLDQVAVEMARRALPANTRAVFDKAIQAGRLHALKSTSHPYPQIGMRPAVVANALHKVPALRKLPLNRLASTLSQPKQSVSQGIAAFINRFGGGDTGSFESRDVAEWDSAETAALRIGVRIPAGIHLPPGLERMHGLVASQHPSAAPRPRMSRTMLKALGRVGGPQVARALRLSSDTGADDDGPPFPPPSKYPNGYPGDTYTVKSGDNPSFIARDITGEKPRWKELLAANPTKKHPDPTYGMNLKPGDKLVVPMLWRASAAPAAPAVPAPLPLPQVPVIPNVVIERPDEGMIDLPVPGFDPGTFEPLPVGVEPRTGLSEYDVTGPPFPPPSKYPGGYEGTTYTVKAGDNPSYIARDFTGEKPRWKELLAANPTKKHPDPTYGMDLKPGDKLVVPAFWRARAWVNQAPLDPSRAPIDPVTPPVIPPVIPPIDPTVPPVIPPIDPNQPPPGWPPGLPWPPIPVPPIDPTVPPVIPPIDPNQPPPGWPPGLPWPPIPVTPPVIPPIDPTVPPVIPPIDPNQPPPGWPPGLPWPPIPVTPPVIPPIDPTEPPVGPLEPPPATRTDGRAQVMQTQGLLAVFGKQQGVGTEVAAMAYGSAPGDLSGDWGERSTRAMQAFQIWANANGYGPIPTSGQPDSISHAALFTVVSNAKMPGKEPGKEPAKKSSNGLAIMAGGFALGKAMGWF